MLSTTHTDWNILWTTWLCCGQHSGQCDPQYIDMHPQYNTHNIYPHSCNLSWEMYCGGQGICCEERIVGNILWVIACILWATCCGQHSRQCDPQYIDIYPQYNTHNTCPSFMKCIVGNLLRVTYCGEHIVGDNIYPVDDVLWRIMYILWVPDDVNVWSTICRYAPTI